MTRRAKIWLLAAGVYAFINVGGLAIAAVRQEEMHAMLHLFLLLLGVAGYVGYRLARRGAPEDHLPRAELAEGRIEYLQQSVDAMALELEYKMGYATPNGGREMERYLKALTALCSLMVKAGLSLIERERVMAGALKSTPEQAARVDKIIERMEQQGMSGRHATEILAGIPGPLRD